MAATNSVAALATTRPLASQPVRRRRRRHTAGWAFVAPYLVLLTLFGLAPAVYGLYQAFIVSSVVGNPTYSLTANFLETLRDYRLPGAAEHVGLYLLLWLPVMLVVVFTIALVMDARRTKFATLTRFVAYVPGAITGSAAALLWLFMFSPNVSPIGFILRHFTPSSGSFISNGTLPIVLTVMGIAAGSGGWIVLLFGVLTAIDRDILEAARVDGANSWRTVWSIKLPLIRKYIAFILIISTAQGFQVFVEPTVLQAGAGGQISSTWSINQLVYSYATVNANYGRAAALAMALLIVTVAMAVLVIKKTNFYSTGDR